MTGHAVTVAVATLVGLTTGPALAAATTARSRLAGWRWLTGYPTSLRRRAMHAGLAGVACGSVAVGVGTTAVLPAYLALALAAAALTVIDIEQRRLPDRLVLPAAGGGLVVLGTASLADGEGGRYVGALLAAVVVGAVLSGLWWADPSGLGFGDVKAAAMVGLYLGYAGWGPLLAGLLGAFVLVAGAALVMLAAGRARRGSALPFGPALFVAALAAIALA